MVWNKGEGSFGMLVLVVTTVNTGEANLVQSLLFSIFLVKDESHEAAPISNSFIRYNSGWLW